MPCVTMPPGSCVGGPDVGFDGRIPGEGFLPQGPWDGPGDGQCLGGTRCPLET